MHHAFSFGREPVAALFLGPLGLGPIGLLSNWLELWTVYADIAQLLESGQQDIEYFGFQEHSDELRCIGRPQLLGLTISGQAKLRTDQIREVQLRVPANEAISL